MAYISYERRETTIVRRNRNYGKLEGGTEESNGGTKHEQSTMILMDGMS